MSTPPRPLVADDLFRRLCRARDYLHAHAGEPIGLDDLAGQAALSRYHFLRRFRDAFGVTPHEYLTRERLRRAKLLLAAGRCSVTDVCFDVGFASLGSFSTLFAGRFGCPPSAWRRRFWQVAERPSDRAMLCVPWCFAAHFGAA